MPTYAYACKDCTHAFDIHQSFTDDSLTVCPECEGTLRKKFNSVGVVFKGSGFYRNDSRDATASSGARKESGSSNGSGGSSGSTDGGSDDSSSSSNGSSGSSGSSESSAGSSNGSGSTGSSGGSAATAPAGAGSSAGRAAD